MLLGWSEKEGPDVLDTLHSCRKSEEIYKVFREPEGKWLLGKTSLSGLNSFYSE
jgi:hypothetical protein